MNFGNEFKKYATKHMGLNSLNVEALALDQVKAQTPYILEEREMRMSQLDVFSRLMMDRIIWISSDVNERMGAVVQAQLMFLDSVDNKKDITLHCCTPGGSVMAGLGIRDVMNYIGADVATVNTGMCASMGSILLSSGKKGKRSSLIASKVMTHQVGFGSQGKVDDCRISQMEAEKYNYILFKILAENCGKSFDEIFDISRVDRWFNSDQALAFGLVDEVIGVDKYPSISKMLEGFDEYYKKEVLLDPLSK